MKNYELVMLYNKVDKKAHVFYLDEDEKYAKVNFDTKIIEREDTISFEFNPSKVISDEKKEADV